MVAWVVVWVVECIKYSSSVLQKGQIRCHGFGLFLYIVSIIEPAVFHLIKDQVE